MVLAILLCCGLYLPAHNLDAYLHPAELVSAAQRSQVAFTPAHTLFRQMAPGTADRSAVSQVLHDEVLLEFEVAQAYKLLAEAPPAIALRLPLPGGGLAHLKLVEIDLLAENFFVNTEKEPGGIDYLPGRHYRGVVDGVPGSMAAVSIFRDQVMGTFATPNAGNFVLGKLQEKSAEAPHILYRQTDLQANLDFECGLNGAGPVWEEEANPVPESTANPCVKVYFEVDSDVRSNLGGVTAAANYVTGMFNQSATIFAMENIDYEISQIFVWAGNSPYQAGASNQLLGDFKAQVNTLNGDLGHLLTNRSSGGVAAGFNGLCNSNIDNSLCISDVYNYYSTVPTYSWDVYVVTHEMGHLNGSPHTHACTWNSNLSAIDGCAGYTEGDCQLPGVPSQGGTIMSYCQNAGVGINFSLGFGPQPGGRIRSAAGNANCLGQCGLTPPVAACGLILDNFPYWESFEENFGAWKNATNDDMDWIRDSGGTPTQSTGPNHASDSTVYIYIEATGHYPRDTAILNGPCFDLSDKIAAQFDFGAHMYGAAIGTLKLDASTDSGNNWATIWTRSGNQGTAWLQESVDLATYLGDTVQLRFVANTTFERWGDIALDGFSLVTQDSVLPPPDPCDGVAFFTHSADFELGEEHWLNVPGDDFDWLRIHENLTPQNYIPRTAASGNYFRCAQASLPGEVNYPRKTAYLEGPCYMPGLSPSSYFRFKYHMYGAEFSKGIGSLYLEVSTDHGATWAGIWSRSGHQGKAWNSAVVGLGNYGGDTIRLRFKVVTGTAGAPNIAVDEFRFDNFNPASDTKPEEMLDEQIRLFPNPSSGTVQLEVFQLNDGQISVTISDVLGRAVWESRQEGNAGGNLYDLELDGLGAGTYFVIVERGGSKVVKRLVRQ